MQARRIALFLRATDNDYQDRQRESCHASSTRHRISVTEFNARNDYASQSRQIQDCLQSPAGIRPRILLVNPVRETSLGLLARLAASMGIGWVTLNRSSDYLGELRREYPELPFFSINPDQRQIGRLQGEQWKSLLPEGGEVFYIQGPRSTSSASLRLAGAERELAATRISLHTCHANWSMEGGAEAARNWLSDLRGRELSRCIVSAQNDSMADGARGALAEGLAVGKKRFEDLRFTGCDGSPKYGQRLVTERRLAATVDVPPTAGRAVELIASVLDGARPPTSDVIIDVASFPELSVLVRETVRNLR
jgi:ABC-type sugar transport system substrate-binding protein